MTAAVATWPARRPRGGPRPWEAALFALAFAVSGLVVLTLVFAGPATYADIARSSGRETATFSTIGLPRVVELGLDQLLGYHVMWTDYVTGRSPGIFRVGGGGAFTPAEYSHMADVRSVFITAQIAAVCAALVLIWLALRGWRRRALARLVRAGAVSALVAVAVIGVLAAVAFDAAFLLFHQVFFPQGNFLFAPDSNLLAIYPESYFYGVSLRIGAAFVALAGVLAVVSHAALRRRSASA